MATKLTLAAADSATAAPGSAVDPKLLGPWQFIVTTGFGAVVVNISVAPDAFVRAKQPSDKWPLDRPWDLNRPNVAIILAADGKPEGYLQFYPLADGDALIVYTFTEGGGVARFTSKNGGSLVDTELVTNPKPAAFRATNKQLSQYDLKLKTKPIVNNLRQLATAGQERLLDHSIQQVGYSDLVGTQKSDYTRSIPPVDGEDYTNITITQTTTQISVTTKDYGTVTYNL